MGGKTFSKTDKVTRNYAKVGSRQTKMFQGHFSSLNLLKFRVPALITRRSQVRVLSPQPCRVKITDFVIFTLFSSDISLDHGVQLLERLSAVFTYHKVPIYYGRNGFGEESRMHVPWDIDRFDLETENILLKTEIGCAVRAYRYCIIQSKNTMCAEPGENAVLSWRRVIKRIKTGTTLALARSFKIW